MFAALDALQDNVVERTVPAGKIVHPILDSYATRKQPNSQDWLADHPSWMLHFTPTLGSWLNALKTGRFY